MGYIKLNPKDAERYGVGERVDFEFTAIGVRQRAAFEKGADGPKRPFRWLLDQMAGIPELDEHQNPIPVPAYNVDGTPKLDDDGEPEMTLKLVRDLEAVAMFVWLVLWGAGVRTPWDGFDVLEYGLELHFFDDDEDGQGKADPPAPADTSTTTS